ncbi:MAG TPA: response regulator [Spirochaetota bacterium]|nr:response regulator [Spirochaetota bacterium]HOL58015.1 response regulator [Spirochaetota bacterium]HPP04350.1 response regulator [Spirochaetota bacterium]
MSKKILIIDDDKNFISKIVSKYCNEDCSFLIADSLERARNIMKYNDFDIIIANVKIPGGNSLEFKKEIKNPETKFLFMSNFDSDLQYVKSNGYQCYFKYDLDISLRNALQNV